MLFLPFYNLWTILIPYNLGDIRMRGPRWRNCNPVNPLGLKVFHKAADIFSHSQKEPIMLNVSHIFPFYAFICLLVLIEFYIWGSGPFIINFVLCFGSPGPLSKVNSCIVTSETLFFFSKYFWAALEISKSFICCQNPASAYMSSLPRISAPLNPAADLTLLMYGRIICFCQLPPSTKCDPKF